MAYGVGSTAHTCDACGATFHRPPAKTRGRWKACSRSCSTVIGNWQRARRAYESVRAMTESERAWLAAAIDGEGCIGYVDSYPRLTIVNTSWDFLARAHTFTGVGRLRSRRKEQPHHADQWDWTLDGYAALAVLEQVVDWLVIKQDKAVAAMATRLDSLVNLAHLEGSE